MLILSIFNWFYYNITIIIFIIIIIIPIIIGIDMLISLILLV